MAGPKAYGFKRHIVQWGPYTLSEFADGDDVCRVKPSVEDFTDEVGADGIMTRIEMADQSATIEVDLAYTSPMNTIFTTVLAADHTVPGSGIMPLFIKDLNGGTTHLMTFAWISKKPDDSIGKKPGKRTWTLRTDLFTAGYAGA